MRLLLAEDERDLNRVITKKLTGAGYCVDSCEDGESALEYFRMADYDAAILDIMMPHISGIELLKKIRQEGNGTPVLFLTARDAITDRVEGLDAGANDYLIKPFAFDELFARIRVLTRERVGSTSNIFSAGDLSVDIGQHRVMRKGQEILLSAKEFALLEHLIQNKNTVLSREQIEGHIWNFDYEGASNMVDVYIRYLRKKIDDPFDKKLIHTVRGRGYVLREDA